MTLEARKPSGREKDQEAVELLGKLREKLHSEDISTARLAGYNLSWMQEDGLEILREALFGDFSRTAKKAAAYGLRRMQGRMKKLAVEVLREGQKHQDRTTRQACTTALSLMAGKPPPQKRSGSKTKSGRLRIKEIRNKRSNRARSPERRRNSRR
ncbi:MAG: hypothetical protein JSU94_17425 [Phycisphaerales bacterium]|nr:MAG: hypothetical protein JSU94_17425 [Phycisphaerales bacterium]